MASQEQIRGSGPKRIIRFGAVAVGLAVGLSGAYVFASRDGGGSGGGRAEPSVQVLSLPGDATAAPAGGEAPPVPLAAEPADAAAAVALLLGAQAGGDPASAYLVLDEASRRRFPSPAAWVNDQPRRLPPLSFQVTGSAPAGAPTDEAVDVSVTVEHRPSLDPFRGLVPARSEQVWRAHGEGDVWRVAADPVSVRPVVPSDATAADAVQAWLGAMGACDAAGARALQALEPLYGPADLSKAPCLMPGTWTAGAPLTLDQVSDSSTLLAAFGGDVSTWARAVPVRGPGPPFLAAVAPVDGGWRVMAVLRDSP